MAGRRLAVVAPCLLLLAATARAQIPSLDEEIDVSIESPPPRVNMIDDLPDINLTAVKHHAGEVAVGATAGALGAWLLHRLQSTVLLVSVLGSVGTAAALHLKWVSTDQVHLFARAALRFVSKQLNRGLREADLDDDGEVTFEDSRIAYSRVAPLVRRHTALTGGLVGGFVFSYGALR